MVALAGACSPEGPGPVDRPARPPAPTSPTTAPTPPPPREPEPATVDAVDLTAALRVEREHGAGYDRDLFGDWGDADGDCLDTRAQVLIDEGFDVLPVACEVVAGLWYSPFDDTHTSRPGAVEIDHLVPLKEAWDSGAWAWTPAERAAFANDLDHPEALVAVTGTSNNAKGDRDPSNWMPPNRAAWCGYAADWVRVKVAWGLSADESEAGRLRSILRGCAGDETLVGLFPDPPPDLPVTTVAPPGPAAAATTTPAPPAAEPGCHPSYDPCVPVASDVDCRGGRGDGPAYTGRVRVIGPDVYRLDGDGDGIACDAA